MSWVKSNLLAGEKVVFRTGFSPFLRWTAIIICAGLPILCAFSGIGYVLFDLGFFGTLFGGLAICAPIGCVVHFGCEAVEFAVTNRRVVSHSWLGTFELLLTKVESIGQSGGSVVLTGTGGSPHRFRCLADGRSFQRELRGAVDKAQQPEPVKG